MLTDTPATTHEGTMTATDWRTKLFEALHANDTKGIVAAFDGLREQLVNENGELERALSAATTPDIYGDWEGTTTDADDIDSLSDDLRVGQIREVWANRTLGTRWIARVRVSASSDEDDDDFETRLYDTREEAVAAARSSRPDALHGETT